MYRSTSHGLLERFRPPLGEAVALCSAINAPKASAEVSELLRQRVRDCEALMKYVHMLDGLSRDVPLFDGAADDLLEVCGCVVVCQVLSFDHVPVGTAARYWQHVMEPTRVCGGGSQERGCEGAAHQLPNHRRRQRLRAPCE